MLLFPSCLFHLFLLWFWWSPSFCWLRGFFVIFPAALDIKLGYLKLFLLLEVEFIAINLPLRTAFAESLLLTQKQTQTAFGSLCFHCHFFLWGFFFISFFYFFSNFFVIVSFLSFSFISERNIALYILFHLENEQNFLFKVLQHTLIG